MDRLSHCRGPTRRVFCKILCVFCYAPLRAGRALMTPTSCWTSLSLALRNRVRRGQRLDTADRRCARRKRRGRDEELVTLGGSRTTGHALTGKGVDVRVRCCETIREGLQE